MSNAMEPARERVSRINEFKTDSREITAERELNTSNCFDKSPNNNLLGKDLQKKNQLKIVRSEYISMEKEKNKVFSERLREAKSEVVKKNQEFADLTISALHLLPLNNEELKLEMNMLQNNEIDVVKSPKAQRTTTGIKKFIRQRHRTELRIALNIKSWVILPEDPFKTAWSFFVLILLLYAILVTPYRVAFVETDTLVWVIIDAFIDLCFLCDLILNLLFFAYYDSDEELIFDRKKIALRYIKSWLIIDLIAIIPFNLFYTKDYSSLSRLSRLPRLYRILRTIRLCREKSNWMEYAPTVSVASERLIAFVFIILVLVHVTACMWFLLAKIEGIFPDSWVARYSYQDSTNFQIYTASFYFTISTITTVGYGDIVPGTSFERWFVIVTMLIGVMSYSFAISSLSSILTSSDLKQTRKNQALETLRRIDVENNLETALFLRLKKSLVKKFKEVEYIKNRDNLMHLLPRKLRGDLNSAMHESLVRKITIFKDESSMFVEYLARLLKPKKYQAEEIICEEGSSINEIFFIIKGCVEYVLPEYNNTPYLQISKGERFGELEIVQLLLQGRGALEGKRTFTAKAKMECEILLLSKTDLLILYHKYEDQTRAIFEGANLRLKHTIEQKQRTQNGLEQRHSKLNKFIRRMSCPMEHTMPNTYKTGYTRTYSDMEFTDEEEDEGLYSDMNQSSLEGADLDEYLCKLDTPQMGREESKMSKMSKMSKSSNKNIYTKVRRIPSRMISDKFKFRRKSIVGARKKRAVHRVKSDINRQIFGSKVLRPGGTLTSNGSPRPEIRRPVPFTSTIQEVGEECDTPDVITMRELAFPVMSSENLKGERSIETGFRYNLSNDHKINIQRNTADGT